MKWTDAVFLLAYASPTLAGLPFLSRRLFPDLTPTARLAAGFGFGSVLLTWWATILSLANVHWSLLTIATPLLLLALVMARGAGGSARFFRVGARPSTFESVSWLLVFLSALYLALVLLAGGATSSDLFYFWGVKAIHFTLARGIDAAGLAWRYALHVHSNYPPLLSVGYAWAALLSGDYSWWGSILSTAVWWAAAVPLVAALLRPRLDRQTSLAVAIFWAGALSLNLVASRSGGNAEAALLFFVTVAGAGLLGETRASFPARRWLIALALAGAVLSKNEGMLEAALLVGATLIADLVRRKPRPWRRVAILAVPSLIAYAPWLTFELVHGLPVSDPAREPLFPFHLSHWLLVGHEGLRNLGAGSWGLAWLLPVAVVILSARRLSRARLGAALPGLLFVAGMFAFFAFYYLHFPNDPSRLIAWTLPRISQPVLSLWILTAACLSAPSVDTPWQL